MGRCGVEVILLTNWAAADLVLFATHRLNDMSGELHLGDARTSSVLKVSDSVAGVLQVGVAAWALDALVGGAASLPVVQEAYTRLELVFLTELAGQVAFVLALWVLVQLYNHPLDLVDCQLLARIEGQLAARAFDFLGQLCECFAFRQNRHARTRATTVENKRACEA